MKQEESVKTSMRQSRQLRLFGVEIGGPEDGFSLTDPSAFESARRVGADFIDLRPIWSTLEPKVDTFDWRTLDRALESASSVQLPVTITMRFFDSQIPAWLSEESMVNQDGGGFFGYSGDQSRSLSYWGPRARSSYLRLVKALVKRYRRNGSILAWQFFYGYNDSFYFGMWGNREAVYDYSSYSQARYRCFLSRVRKLSLNALNRRYGQCYRRWSEVSQPKPTFGKLNTSLEWHDFQDYRMWSIERMFGDIDQAVRRLDQRPLIMYYGGSLHHSAHQLSAYDIGLRLLRRYGGALDVTCFEDPVPAEVGSGIVRSYSVPLMVEAWQVPPPLPAFRRLFFHAFALGVKSYQMVGSWEKMEVSPEEFRRTKEAFLEMADAEPVRARVAGMISYRTILSHVPARNYINPTLALIPKLQEHQYSLDWHSDLSHLGDLDRYPALLDANSEVLDRQTVERLAQYVARGGRLALLPRSGRFVIGDGDPGPTLLERLHCPSQQGNEVNAWDMGRGHVLRLGQEVDWAQPEGTRVLLDVMKWLGVQRPITATPGVLAALSQAGDGKIYATLHWPGPHSFSGSFAIHEGPLKAEQGYRISGLLGESQHDMSLDGRTLMSGVPVQFGPHELKVLRIVPQ